MKKFILTAVILSVFFTGCSSGAARNPNTDKKIAWEYAGSLPAQKGQEKNIGTAGMMNGNIGDYIVAGGGANFPQKSVLEGGEKKLYSDVYVLEEKNDELKVINHINIDREIGYGASATTEEGIYYIGGGADKKSSRDILLFSISEDKKLKYEKIGELPFSFQNGGAVKKGNSLYIFAGVQDGKPVNKLYEYNILTKEVKKLASIPGAKARTQCVAQILDGELYVFSGGDVTAYTDGYKYNFKTDRWREVSPVKIKDREISLLGASSVKLNDKEMLVIGGFNKKVYDNAVKKLGTLRGQELLRFKAEYFGLAPQEYNWNRDILIYNSEENSWKSIGEIPFNAPCGEGLVLVKNKIFSINGEIKPGVRTNKIYMGTISRK